MFDVPALAPEHIRRLSRREYDITDEDIVVLVHTDPSRDGYRLVDEMRRDRTLRPTQLPAVAIAIADLPWRRPA